MKITKIKVRYGENKNMGNYESLRIETELEAEVDLDISLSVSVDRGNLSSSHVEEAHARLLAEAQKLTIQGLEKVVETENTEKRKTPNYVSSEGSGGGVDNPNA